MLEINCRVCVCCHRHRHECALHHVHAPPAHEGNSMCVCAQRHSDLRDQLQICSMLTAISVFLLSFTISDIVRTSCSTRYSRVRSPATRRAASALSSRDRMTGFCLSRVDTHTRRGIAACVCVGREREIDRKSGVDQRPAALNMHWRWRRRVASAQNAALLSHVLLSESNALDKLLSISLSILSSAHTSIHRREQRAGQARSIRHAMPCHAIPLSLLP